MKAGELQAKWKRRFRSCKPERKGEEVVRRSQTDAVGIQRCWSSSLPWERHKQQILSNTCSKSSPGSAEIQAFQSREKEAWEEDWDERVANGWYEGAAFGSAVDPAEGSDGIGGSFGGGNPSTPRNGARL